MGGFGLGVFALVLGAPGRPWRSPPRGTRWSGWRAPTTWLAIPLSAGPVQCQPYPAHSPQGASTLDFVQSPQQDLDTAGSPARSKGSPRSAASKGTPAFPGGFLLPGPRDIRYLELRRPSAPTGPSEN